MNNKLLKPKDIMKILGVCHKTLYIWDKKGILVAQRLPSGRRYYTQEQVDEILNKRNTE